MPEYKDGRCYRHYLEFTQVSYFRNEMQPVIKEGHGPDMSDARLRANRRRLKEE